MPFYAISTLVRGEPRMRCRAGAWLKAGGSCPSGAGAERVPPEMVGGDDLGHRSAVGARTWIEIPSHPGGSSGHLQWV